MEPIHPIDHSQVPFQVNRAGGRARDGSADFERELGADGRRRGRPDARARQEDAPVSGPEEHEAGINLDLTA